MLRYILLHNQSLPGSQPVKARYCSSFFCRLRGFTFRSSIRPDEALLLVQARDNRLDASIHMLGVWTDLAVVWINSPGDVVDLCLARRWRPAYLPRQAARYILEMAPARLGEFHIGDKVTFEEVALD
jgi:uncharacterized membrane protein (UPF0127 family)